MRKTLSAILLCLSLLAVSTARAGEVIGTHNIPAGPDGTCKVYKVKPCPKCKDCPVCETPKDCPTPNITVLPSPAPNVTVIPAPVTSIIVTKIVQPPASAQYFLGPEVAYLENGQFGGGINFDRISRGGQWKWNVSADYYFGDEVFGGGSVNTQYCPDHKDSHRCKPTGTVYFPTFNNANTWGVRTGISWRIK